MPKIRFGVRYTTDETKDLAYLQLQKDNDIDFARPGELFINEPLNKVYYCDSTTNQFVELNPSALDQLTPEDIKTLYELNPDTNAFTDALKDKAEQAVDKAEANERDIANRDRTNHTGTQTTATISNFDTEVSNNSSVVANTAKVSADGSIATHSDIDLTGIGINQVLKWDGSKFVPSVDDDDFVGVTNLSYTASEIEGTIVSDTGQNATIIAGSTIYASLMLPGDKTKLNGIASGAEVNVQSDWNAVSGDAFILNKPSTFPPSSHTQTASTITDFDTEVSNNTDVAANTSARHDAVTVVDSSEIDFTLTGQQITASIVAGSIDESKLDAGVNASLDLADSAIQPWDEIDKEVVVYLGQPNTDLALVNGVAYIYPFPYYLKIKNIILSLQTPPSGDNVIVDIKSDGNSIFDSPMSVDDGQTLSTQSQSAYVLNNYEIPSGVNLTFDILGIGSLSPGQGAQITIKGVKLNIQFDPLFYHEFWDASKLTLSDTSVTGAKGSGRYGFDLVSTPPVGGQNYPHSLVTLPSGLKAIKGGVLCNATGYNFATLSDFSFCVIFKLEHSGYDRENYSGLMMFLDSAISSSRINVQMGWTTQGGIFFDRNTGQDSYGASSVEDKNVHALVITRESGTLKIYLDGVLAGESINNEAINVTGISYGRLLNSSGVTIDNSNIAILEGSFYDYALNVSLFDSYLQSKFMQDYKPNIFLETPLWLYCSNSIGTGFYYGDSGKTPSNLLFKELSETYLKPQTRWYNLSKGGITTPSMVGQLSDYYLPFTNEKASEINLILHEGSNHIAVGGAVSGLDVYDSLKDFWSAFKNAGADKIFVATILPRSSFDSTKEDIRQSANSLITLNAVSDGATAVINLDEITELSDFNNTNYYSDGTHLTKLGAEIMANEMARIIKDYV